MVPFKARHEFLWGILEMGRQKKGEDGTSSPLLMALI